MPICRVIRFTLQGYKSIRIAGCLSDISSGQVQVQSSLVNTMKLKDPDDEDERMDMDDGYSR